MQFTHEQAWDLLKEYNQEPFHLRHALTVEAVMGWFADALGYGEQAEFWRQVGLLHDLDFEQWPDAHCVKVRELLEARGADAALMKGKRILIVDDVISTGESLKALETLVEEAGGIICGRMAVLAEGDAQERSDLVYLEKLPLFNPDGSVKG